MCLYAIDLFVLFQIVQLNEASAVPLPYPYEMVNKCQIGRQRKGVLSV